MAVVAVVVGAAAFFGGVQYQKSQMPMMANGEGGGNRMMMRQDGPGDQGTMMRGNAGGQGQGQGMAPVSGEIASVDDKSITIKMPDGSSKIVVLSDDTKINKSAEVSKSDLKTGEQVTAFGAEGSDGSITAQSISIGGGMFRMQSEKKQQ